MKARDILPDIIFDINHLHSTLDKYNGYCLLYTHPWRQGDSKGQNILSTPRDSRFDKAEFVGLIYDLVRDYTEQTKWTQAEYDMYVKRGLAELLSKWRIEHDN